MENGSFMTGSFGWLITRCEAMMECHDSRRPTTATSAAHDSPVYVARLHFRLNTNGNSLSSSSIFRLEDFEVKIDDAESVSTLKKAIKAEKPNKIQCDADELQLFLVKKDGGAGAWLTEKDVKEGVSDSDTSDLELLDVVGAPLNLVGLSVEYVRFQVTKKDVKAGKVPMHVLVVVPEGASDAEAKQKAKLTTLAMMLKQCEVVGDLPPERRFFEVVRMDRWRLRKGNGHQSDRRYRAFIGSRFYVRKEILCVLTNFKNIYQSEFDTGKVVNKHPSQTTARLLVGFI
ncbi:hypothetical protein PC128_g26675 [Phytophthora cactorum]|nr:hypothetical protein PC128_g26675 [Phytophthora cactorum]